MLMHTVAMCTSDEEADRGCHSQEIAVKVEVRLERGVGRSCRVRASEIQAFDSGRRLIVRPGEIRPGDWLRDLGTLRQVESIEELLSATGSGRIFVVRFASMAGVEDLALGIPGTVTVTIWRPT
jgi:hypothetical protein